MGFIVGADLHTPAKPGLKRSFIPGFAAVHLALSSGALKISERSFALPHFCRILM
jgi:hypothetical protein